MDGVGEATDAAGHYRGFSALRATGRDRTAIGHRSVVSGQWSVVSDLIRTVNGH